MTREEEINTAASRYIEENTINGYVAISDHKDSFIEGAKWADSNSNSPWISVEDDLPCNHEELRHSFYADKTVYVLVVIHRDFRLSRMIKWFDKWIWESYIPTHWMPIPKLP